MLTYLVVLAWILLNPSARPATSVVLRVASGLRALGFPPVLASGVTVEFALNVAMFLPFAMIGWLRDPDWWSPWAWALAGTATALVAEAAQGALLDGRSASIRDLVANALGAGLGAVLVSVFAPRVVGLDHSVG